MVTMMIIIQSLLQVHPLLSLFHRHLIRTLELILIKFQAKLPTNLSYISHQPTSQIPQKGKQQAYDAANYSEKNAKGFAVCVVQIPENSLWHELCNDEEAQGIISSC